MCVRTGYVVGVLCLPRAVYIDVVVLWQSVIHVLAL